jgi:hypothetical protein
MLLCSKLTIARALKIARSTARQLSSTKAREPAIPPFVVNARAADARPMQKELAYGGTTSQGDYPWHAETHAWVRSKIAVSTT